MAEAFARPGIQRRRLSRGSVELAGPTWWNRYREECVDLATGEILRRQTRMKLGGRAEFRTKRAAEAELERLLALESATSPTPAGTRITARAYFEHYIATFLPLMRANSRRTYTAAIRNHLEPAFEGLWLDQIDNQAAQRLVAQLAPRRARGTVRFVRTVLFQVLRRARADGYAAHALDTKAVQLPKVTTAPLERRHIPADELALIVQEAAWPARALWACLGYGALRIGEALGLTWAAIDFERKLLTIRQACVDGELAPPKTAASVADVPLLPELEAELARYREVWRPNPQRLLFVSRRGRPLRADDVRRRWLQPELARLGLHQAGTHAFRHGAPKRLNDLGLSPATVSRFMRHTSLAMTERYLHHAAESAWAEIHAVTARRAQAGAGKEIGR